MVSDLIPEQWSSATAQDVNIPKHASHWMVLLMGEGEKGALYTQVKTGRGIGKKVVEKYLHL